jgi:hypothetical protein
MVQKTDEALKVPVTHAKETKMPVKVNYPGYSSEAEYRTALADQIAAKAAYAAANDSRLDAAVRRLAPIIKQLREDPARRSTRKLAERLNDRGQHGPNGKPITPSTMRRILERLPELHLGDGPSSRERAASDRRMPYRYRPGRQATFSGLKNTLADIAKAES